MSGIRKRAHKKQVERLESLLKKGPWLFVTALIALPAQAQERSITWDEALRLTVENNPQLKSSRHALEASESRTKASVWGFAPMLSAQMTWGRENRSSLTPSEVSDSYSVSLGLSQTLFDYGTFGSLAQSRAAVRVQSAALTITKAGISRDLKTAFASSAFAQNSVNLASTIISRRQRNLDLVRLRYEGGRENLGAVLLSQANLDEARLGFLESQNALKSAQADLRALLGLNESTSFAVSGRVPTSPPPLSVDFHGLADSTPERARSLATVEASEAAVSTTRGRLLPSLILSGHLGQYGDRFLPQNDGWSVGLSLKIPLLSGSDYHHLQAARAEAASAEQDRRATEFGILVRLQQSHSAFVEADRRERLAQDFLKAARTRAEIAREKYETGLISFDEWDRIESDLIARERAALQNTRDRVTAEAEWEFTLGRGDIP